MPSSPNASSRRHDGKCSRGAPRCRIASALVVVFTLHIGLRAPVAAATTSETKEPQGTSNTETDSEVILIVRTAGDDAVVNRVRADLHAFGWRVIEIPVEDAGAPQEPLTRLASDHAAAAALRVDAALGHMELYVRQGWGNIHEILRSEDGQLDGQVLALRATEALRAHGLRFGPAAGRSARDETSAPTAHQAPTDSEASSSGAVTRPVPAPTDVATVRPHANEAPRFTRGLWVLAAPTAGASPGGMGVGLGILLGARLELTSLWSMAVAGLVPLSSPSVAAAQGSARVATSSLGVTIERMWLQDPTWYCASGLGLGLLWTTAEGRNAETGYATASDTTRTASAQVQVRAGWRLATGWTAFAALAGGTSIPEVEVAFADRVAVTWGQPFLLLSLGAEVRTITW